MTSDDLPIRIPKSEDEDPLHLLRGEIHDAHEKMDAAHGRMNRAVEILEDLQDDIIIQRKLILKLAEADPDLVVEVAREVLGTTSTTTKVDDV